MPILQGASGFTINNSAFHDIQGNATILQFTNGALNDSQIDLVKKHVAGNTPFRDLPRARAAYNDYTSKGRSRVTCFEGTRQTLLQEIEAWITKPPDKSRIYVLSGLAGIGKSTVAQTVAEREDKLGLLGASFFFSRDEVDCRTAEKLFTTIAFQLCVYNQEFAQAIGNTLLTERGSAATTKGLEEQLKVLILEPLQDLVKHHSQPIVVVIDALDECDDQDGLVVLQTLNTLVQELPSFRVILATHPQPYIQNLTEGPGAYEVFYLQNIEDKVVDGDIRLYLKHSLSENQVATRLPMLKGQWHADDEDIGVLVRAAGRLFIIASTAVLFILDKAARDPASQLNKLKNAFAQNRTPFNALNNFYQVVLRSAVPFNSDCDIVGRYQTVLGTIVHLRNPLPVKALANIIGFSSEGQVHAILDNLQPVLLLSGNGEIPRIYHQSFSDYVMDEKRCVDHDLLIISRNQHTRIAMRCLQIMNYHLKQNILDLHGPACFMENEVGMEAAAKAGDRINEKLPLELQYACIYFTDHLEGADNGDLGLRKELETFASTHLVHWFEVLSWIHNLPVAHRALETLQKLSGNRPNTNAFGINMRGLFADGQRFISKFYGVIERSALHTYYSALPFIPTESLLYKRYGKDIVHNPCRIDMTGASNLPDVRKSTSTQHADCVLTNWDPLVAVLSQEKGCYRIAFSQDNSQLASWTYEDGQDVGMKIWDATSGTPCETFDGGFIELSRNFSAVALSKQNTITLHSVARNTPLATIKPSTEILKLAMAFDGSRLATGLSDGTVQLWDGKKGDLVAVFDDYLPENKLSGGDLAFSPNGHRLAYVSDSNLDIRLRDGINGKSIGNLHYHSQGSHWHLQFLFSRDGSRIAAKVCKGGVYSLALWNGVNGEFISVAGNVEYFMEILAFEGSIIATVGKTVQLWKVDEENHLSTLHSFTIRDTSVRLALSGSLFAMASPLLVLLYEVNSGAHIATLPFKGPQALDISPNGTRLAAGNSNGLIHLWDIPSIKTSLSASKEKLSRVSTALAFTPDCSRVAAGFKDGAIEIWDTACTSQPIATFSCHPEEITSLAFCPESKVLASGSNGRLGCSVKLWNLINGVQIGGLKPKFSSGTVSLALSATLLAVGAVKGNNTGTCVELWDRDSFCYVGLLHWKRCGNRTMSFSGDGSLLAVGAIGSVVWDVAKQTTISCLLPHSGARQHIFSNDRTRLAIQLADGNSRAFRIETNSRYSMSLRDAECRNIHSVATAMWNGILPSLVHDRSRGWCLLGQFPERHSLVPMLWIPRNFVVEEPEPAYGTFMFAFACTDGRVLIIQPSTPSVV